MGAGLRRRRGPRLRRWWQRYWWMVLTLGGVTALLLAFLGHDGSLGDRLRAAVSLVPGFGNVSEGSDAELVAHVIAPLVFAYATYRGAAKLFEERFQEVRASRSRGHAIVCGLGGQGHALVDGLLADHRVVAIELDPTNLAIRACRDAGAIVLVGDATDREMLERAQIDRAAYLLAVAGKDAVNAQIAANALELVEQRAGQPLVAFAHVYDPRLFLFLLHRSFARPSVRLEFFNAYERGARALLEQANLRASGTVLVVGVGQLGQALVSEIGRRRLEQARADGRPEPLRVHLVDREARTRCRALHERYSRLADVCELEALDLDVESTEFDRLLETRPELAGASVAYVCFDDDALTITATLSLLDQAREPFPVVARVSQQSFGLSALLQEEVGAGLGSGRFRPLSLAADATRTGAILEGRRGLIAREIHREYERPGASSPYHVPWEQLTVEGREQNLVHADDLARQLGEAGYRLRPLLDWGEPPLDLSREEIGRMAEIEHERWRAMREADGWRYGPERDDVAKLNPYLVPWTELKPERRDLSRRLVANRPAMLARVGIRIERA